MPCWSALDVGVVGAALGVVLPVVPVGVGVDVLPDVPTGEGSAGVAGVGDGVGSVGCAAGVLGVVAGVLGCAAAAGSAPVAGDAAGDALAVAPPPAAFSKSIKCARNSTSLARIVGSTDDVVPDVPTAPAAPGAGAGAAAAGDSSARWSPTSAFRFAWTLAYDARHSVLVVISSLKFEISCETCVRASPVSCAAAGSWVSWLRLSRAAVRCRLTASVSTDAADGGCCSGGCCAAGAAGSVGVGVVAGLGLLAAGG